MKNLVLFHLSYDTFNSTSYFMNLSCYLLLEGSEIMNVNRCELEFLKSKAINLLVVSCIKKFMLISNRESIQYNDEISHHLCFGHLFNFNIDSKS